MPKRNWTAFLEGVRSIFTWRFDTPLTKKIISDFTTKSDLEHLQDDWKKVGDDFYSVIPRPRNEGEDDESGI